MMSCADRMPEMPGASDPTEGYFFVLDTGDGRGTRASVTSDWSTLADEGDIFGAFNLGNASDPKNVPYAVRSVGDRQVLVPAVEGTELTKQTTDYLFYYPYDPEMTMEKARDLEHSVMADQQQDGAFESSDLLWDVAHASDTKCLVALDHAMASITVIAQAEGNDFFNGLGHRPDRRRSGRVGLRHGPERDRHHGAVRPLLHRCRPLPGRCAGQPHDTVREQDNKTLRP